MPSPSPRRRAMPMPTLATALALAAPLSAAAGAVLAGASWPEFSHLEHPLPMPGAAGLRLAQAYNGLVFVVPGLLAAVLAWILYEDLDRTAGWSARIGSRLLLIAGAALAAQGVWSLDLHDLDGPGGGLHAAAWLVWWLAAAAGLSLLGTWRWRAWAWPLAVALAALSAWPHWPWPEAVGQRLALAAWFAGWAGWALWLRRPRDAAGRAGG